MPIDSPFMPSYVIRQCGRPSCRLRYPSAERDAAAASCPGCGAPAEVVARVPARAPGPPARGTGRGQSICLLLDNLRSVYNVGSIFRSVDGAGLSQLYLCGITATPDQTGLAKTALGAEQSVTWSYHPNALFLAHSLLKRGTHLWALEATATADSIFDAAPECPMPLVLVVGNEISGVDPDLMAACERTVMIPMYGRKGSLNVATAAGVAAYVLTQKW